MHGNRKRCHEGKRVGVSSRPCLIDIGEHRETYLFYNFERAVVLETWLDCNGNLHMKRDMNLIRLLLLETEGEEPKPDVSAFTEARLLYHSALLIEAGLVHGTIILDNGQPINTVTLRLTWAGHEFIDAARNDTVWRKALERIKKSGVDVPLSLLKEILTQVLKQSLGLP